METGLAILALFSRLVSAGAAVAPGHSIICGQPLQRRVYLWEDKLAGGKQSTCETCAAAGVLPLQRADG